MKNKPNPNNYFTQFTSHSIFYPRVRYAFRPDGKISHDKRIISFDDGATFHITCQGVHIIQIHDGYYDER